MADNGRIHSRRVKEHIRRVKAKNRPRTWDEIKNTGRGNRTLIKKNLKIRSRELNSQKRGQRIHMR